jgi:hypothetical protein
VYYLDTYQHDAGAERIGGATCPSESTMFSVRDYLDHWYKDQTDAYPDEEEIEAIREQAERTERANVPSDSCTEEDDEPTPF